MHDWSAAAKRYRLFRKDKVGRQGRGVSLYVKEQLDCTEFCLGMDNEPTESLWVKLKSRPVWVTEWMSAIGHLIRNNK